MDYYVLLVQQMELGKAFYLKKLKAHKYEKAVYEIETEHEYAQTRILLNDLELSVLCNVLKGK